MVSPRPSGPRVHLSLLGLLALAVVLFMAGPVGAQDPNCDRAGCGTVRNGPVITCFTPATPPPSTLWSSAQLQPAWTGALPPDRDSTNFNELYENYGSRNWFEGVEIQNGYILMALAHGIGIWDAHTDPANPALVAAARYPAITGQFPFLPTGELSKIVFGGIAAPDDTVAAITGYSGAGILVFDLTDKTHPRPAYQNAGKTSDSVYAAKIGGTRYAFLSANGLYVYNLDKAITYNACLETDGVNAGACPGVLVKQVQTDVSAGSFVGGVDNFVAVTLGSGGFQIFDMTNPLNPVAKLTGARDRPVQGIAMWKQGTSYYLAARLGKSANVRLSQTAIYDVSCIVGGCGGLGGALATVSTDSLSGTEYLSFSRSGNIPFLYAGGDGYCSGADGQQREWLFDVSNPAAPKDITPGATADSHAFYLGVDTHVNINYWSYFYRGSPTGFNLVAPRAGKFNGDYFYRAGRSVFDVHKWIHNVAPTADFSYSPTEIYPGTPVTFTDRSAGVPTNWSWTFQDGSPASSTAQNPAAVTFATPGTKSVSLTASNAQGPSSNPKSVVVLPPAPQIGGITVSPASPLVCQPVTLTTTGVTGQPTLNYSWGVKDSGNNPVAGSSSTGTLIWATTGLTAGTYTATVTVTNGAGTANKSATVTLGALPALTDISNAAPTAAITNNSVKLTVPASQGATVWEWTYGDGTKETLTDPIQGPSPTHVYASIGQYTATVKISNCVNQTGFTSQAVVVNVIQTTPLKALFQAQLFCGVYCSASTGQTIVFTDSSTGAELYDYDWDHAANDTSCNFTDTGHATAVTSHVYAAAGDFYPCLRVRRGASEQNVTVHKQIKVSGSGGGGGGGNGGGGGGGNTPAISIGGVSTGSVNTPYIFSAQAFNCTPADGAWAWSTGGGTITGASNGSAVTITWASAGAKSVSVTNSGCAGANGALNVTISEGNGGGGGGGGGGTLGAQFSFSPSSPNPGDTVSFDASASTGSPTGYSWNFGDGTGTVTGKNATHAYAAAGSYSVQLTVSAPGTGCPFAPCLVTASTTKTVVVNGTPPPPPVTAEFTTSVSCTNVGGFDQCQADTGKAVTFTATATDANSYQWSFGDGGTATSAATSHTFAQAGSYFVSLTVTKGSASATKSRRFIVTGSAPKPTPKSVVLPWIAQTRGALVQSSDLYVHNPSANPMSVTLEFRKRGLPDTNPPRVAKTIAPGATLYVADVLRELFNRENIAGFISLTVDQGDMEPVITSYNTTVQADGKQFGQTISGISMSSLSSAATAKDGSTSDPQNLVGLINNSDRLAYFGVSNPSENPVNYRLRLYDKLGKLIGQTSQDLTVAPFGQRQFQSAEIESTFGVTNQDDYRVEVQATTGGDSLVPYASNLRLSSQDPAFIEAGSSKNVKSYLLGALSAPGANSTVWRSDLLLSNVNTQPVSVDVTFTGIGVNAAPTAPLHVTLQPGETQRLQNVIASQWGISNAIGLLTVKSSSPNGIFPIVQGESYENSNPTKRFGQSMAALTDADAAGAGHGQYLAGLRQDATHRTTLWLYNPGDANGVYDLVFRGLDGTVINTVANVQLAGGKLRQFTPAQLPLPAAGAQSGFTVQIVVKSGQVLSAAQVVDNGTNDPSYIQGEVR
jgi:PKD repeat protein